MPFFGKIGVAKSQLAQIILFLVVAMAVIGPAININNFAKASTDVEKCRLSVITASTRVGWGGIHLWDMSMFAWDAPNPFYIDCPKRYVYVSNDNIKADNVNTKLETDDEKERERQLKEFILGEMTKCWKSFGDASDTIYSASAGVGEGSIDVDKTACFSCSEVFFKDDFKAATIGDADFYEYANGKSMLIGDQSYVEFLTGGNAPPELPKVFGKEDKITLEKNQQWSTVFTIKKISLGFFGDKWNWVPLIEDINVPPVNGGIVDCSVVKEDGKFEDIDRRLTYAIGCKATEPPTIKGFVFGKVARGVNRLDVNFLEGGLLVDRETVRYPMTVRFIPTEDVFGEGKEKCKRLY